MTKSPDLDQARVDGARPAGLPLVAPDVEEEFGDLDNIVPTRGYDMTPMVGLGASAGGIPALIEFFKAMPVDTGMVFIVILHLSPDHDSSLAALLGRCTTMPAVEAVDGAKAEPNHIYVIPPGKYLTATDGHLRLVPLEPERGKRVAVDMFFRSLADTHGPHAMAVVLSGVDGDGALGIKRVKERGGLTVAQDPSESEHPGMPRSAIGTGMVDWVLEVAKIPARLVAYMNQEAKLRLPPEEGPAGVLVAPSRPASDLGESALREVLVFVRTRTGRDFSCYKRATVLRRIARRMQVNGVDSLPDYVGYVRTHAGEAGALLQDLLISVTNFFRDRDSFDAVERRIPALFEGKTPSDNVRVWVPACATGEEAYSFAMLLLEHADTLEVSPRLQILACDLNDDAIAVARAGFYPLAIEADVSEARLRRFFVREAHGYRVRREVRELVLFAAHDLLKDPPFSRLDLVSCRNLLIYLNRDAQERVLATFHFALVPAGTLFLGSSEAVDEQNRLFRVLDKKHRLYSSIPSLRGSIPIPIGPSTALRPLQATANKPVEVVVHGKTFADAPLSFSNALGRELDRAARAELHFMLLERYGPPSIVVNAEHDIVHLSDHAGKFLRFAGGEPTTNLMRVVNPALSIELRAALFRAAESGSTVDTFGVPIDLDGARRFVDLHITPADEVGHGFFLVVFDAREAEDDRSAALSATPPTSEAVARHVERELEQIKARWRDTVEQYEASTEELKASNEELQAMNEELRSATEELETSREELQSINEELTTVNHEMRTKVDELATANSDLQNLMASTPIATVFLDRELTIMRFTPNVASIFNMIPSDVGRPLEHLKHKLEYPELLADAAHVLRSLAPVEHEVTDGSRWYLTRLQPYRTVEDHIGGIVLTLVDVTERKQATEALRLSEERMRLVIESARDWAIFTLDLDRKVSSWNAGAEALFGYHESDIVGQRADSLLTAEERSNAQLKRDTKLAREAGRAQNERWHVRKDGTTFYGSGSLMPLRDKADALRGFVMILRDLTENKKNEEALRTQLDELTRFNSAAVGRELRMVELKKEVNDLCRRAGEEARYAIVPDSTREGTEP